jgi:hypothetical protein
LEINIWPFINSTCPFYKCDHGKDIRGRSCKKLPRYDYNKLTASVEINIRPTLTKVS